MLHPRRIHKEESIFSQCSEYIELMNIGFTTATQLF